LVNIDDSWPLDDTLVDDEDDEKVDDIDDMIGEDEGEQDGEDDFCSGDEERATNSTTSCFPIS
jgi:hypothetical protein